MRLADSQCINPWRLRLTTHYIEGVAEETKTSERHLQREGVPCAAPRIGISGIDWGAAWLALRDHVLPAESKALSFLGTAHRPRGDVLMPVVLSNGSSITWTREILKGIGADPQEVCEITDHSTKVTSLSWARMRGFPENTLELLAFHRRSDGLRRAYGRDLLEHPLRLLRGMYGEIRDGSFIPDEARGQRLTDDPMKELSSLMPQTHVDAEAFESPVHLDSFSSASLPQRDFLPLDDIEAAGLESPDGTGDVDLFLEPQGAVSDASEDPESSVPSDEDNSLYQAVVGGSVDLLKGTSSSQSVFTEWVLVNISNLRMHRLLEEEAECTACGIKRPAGSWVETFSESLPYLKCTKSGCWTLPFP